MASLVHPDGWNRRRPDPGCSVWWRQTSESGNLAWGVRPARSEVDSVQHRGGQGMALIDLEPRNVMFFDKEPAADESGAAGLWISAQPESHPEAESAAARS